MRQPFNGHSYTVYPNKYAHGFVVLCFVVVMQSFIMNSHEVFIHIHQGCFAGTGAIVRLPQCQWSKPDGYGKISQCITTTKHSKAKTVCIFLGIYCTSQTESLYWNNTQFLISDTGLKLLPKLFPRAIQYHYSTFNFGWHLCFWWITARHCLEMVSTERFWRLGNLIDQKWKWSWCQLCCHWWHWVH